MDRAASFHSRCRSCDAPVMWAVFEKSGKRVPLDREPVATGTLVIVRAGADPIVRVAQAGELGRRYSTHFATCPEAKSWSRKKK